MNEDKTLVALRGPDWQDELTSLGDRCFGNEKFSTSVATSGPVLEQFLHMLEKRDLDKCLLLMYTLDNVACNSAISVRERVIRSCNGRLLGEILAVYEWTSDSYLRNNIITFLSFITHSPDAAAALITAGVTDLFQAVLADRTADRVDSVYAMSLMGLANMLGREEMSDFTAHSDTIEPIFVMMEAALTGEAYADFYWIPQYVLPALVNLSIGDKNKQTLFELKLVPLLFRVLVEENLYADRYPNLVDVEFTRQMTLRVLLNMSFVDQAKSQMPLDVLNMLTKNLKSKESSRLLKRLIWAVHPEDSKPVDLAQAEAASRAVERLTSGAAGAQNNRFEGKFVMISYSWAQQPLAVALASKLREFGVSYWLDKEQMSGSTLEAMAAAVEGCCAVLCCVSKEYKESEPCQREADYAYKMKKPIIPIKVRIFRPAHLFCIFLHFQLYVYMLQSLLQSLLQSRLFTSSYINSYSLFLSPSDDHRCSISMCLMVGWDCCWAQSSTTSSMTQRWLQASFRG